MPSDNFKFKILNFKFLSRGFSLVEILVAISLLIVITAVAIPNLRNFNKSQEIDNAAQQLANILKRAQSSAASRITCPSGVASNSWQVNLNVAGANDTYTLVANCVSAPLQPTLYTSPFASTPTSTNTFQAVTNICGAGVNASLFFTNQQFTLQCTAGAVQTATIRITLSDTSGQSRVVVVESGGIVRIE